MTFNSYQRSYSKPNNFKYNGKEGQEETGWLDYGARMYQADLGRWFNVDPLADKNSFESPYTMVSNNPIIYLDPNGEDKIKAAIFNKLSSGTQFALMANYDTEKGTGSIKALISNSNGMSYVNIDLSSELSNQDKLVSELVGGGGLSILNLLGKSDAVGIDGKGAVEFLKEFRQFVDQDENSLTTIPALLGNGSLKEEMLSGLGDDVGNALFKLYKQSEGTMQVYNDGENGFFKILDVGVNGTEGSTFRINYNDIQTIELETLKQKYKMEEVGVIQAIMDYYVSTNEENNEE